MRRCLIIDDSPIIRRVARTLLERMDFVIDEAEAVPEAIERCREEMHDVVLLDWQLPTTSAIDFLAEMRGSTASARPYIIYCTTANDPLDISRALNAGADDYLLKPFVAEDLEAKFATIPAAA